MSISAVSEIVVVMAAVRLDDEADNIEKTLALALIDRKAGSKSSTSM